MDAPAEEPRTDEPGREPAGSPLPVPPDEIDSGSEESADPYAREAAIEQLIGPADVDE